MPQKSALITGAAGALGSSFALSLHAECPDLVLELADLPVKELQLKAIAEQTGATKLHLDNIFHPESVLPYTDDDVIVWNAAVNVDDLESGEARTESRLSQNRTLENLIRGMLAHATRDTRRRLLVAVCSITAKYGENTENEDFQRLLRQIVEAGQGLQYGQMKTEQAALLRARRPELEAAGVDVSVLYPGSFNSPFTDVKQALAHAKSLGRRMKGFEGRKDWVQTRAFEPSDITRPVAGMVRQWTDTGTFSADKKEWVMLNDMDLGVTPPTA